MILTGVFLIAFLALVIYASVRTYAAISRQVNTGTATSVPMLPWLFAGGMLVLFLISTGLREVPAGTVGVVSQFGQVQAEELPPGLHWVTPFINNVTMVSTRVKAIKIEGYTAASREQQDLFMNLTLNYHVDPAKASEIVQQVGTDFEAKIVSPRFLDIPKSVTDDYATSVVLNSRDEIRSKSIELLRTSLEPYGFVVDGLNLENFSYSPEYNAAIEARAVAEQQVQTRRQELEQAKVQAEQAKVEAEGQANAAIERARGESEANRLLSESLTAELIQWAAIQKLQDNINIALVPSDGGLILDVGNLQQEKP